MVAVYSSNPIAPAPPQLAAAEYSLVAEISNSATTVGIAPSALSLSGYTAQQIGEQLDEMLAIGLTNIRVAVSWFHIDAWGPADPNDNGLGALAWANMDLVITEAAKRNVGVLAEINATPMHALVSGIPGSGTPDVAMYTDFLKRFMGNQIVVNGVATTYGAVVSAYEIWNEPNSMQFSTPINPEAYAQLLRASYTTVKQYDPTATVVGGSVGAGQDGPFGITMNPVTFVERMLAELDRLNALPGAIANPGFDALAFHPYSQEISYKGSCPTCIPGMLTPREQVEVLKAMIDGRKIWITEYGMPTYDAPPAYDIWGNVFDRPAITEAQQSEWIHDLLKWWKDHPEQAGPIFLYTNRDTVGAAPTVDEGNFGLWKLNPVTGKWVLKTAGEMLKAWLAPVTPPTGTPAPTNPFQAIVAMFQAISQQFTQFFQSFAQIGQAFANAISNFFAVLTGRPPTPAPAPQTTMLRIASVDGPEENSAAADGETDATDAAEQEPAEPAALLETPHVDESVTAATEPIQAVVAETMTESSTEASGIEAEPAQTPAEDTTPKAAAVVDDDTEADEGKSEAKTAGDAGDDAEKTGNKAEPGTTADDSDKTEKADEADHKPQDNDESSSGSASAADSTNSNESGSE